MRSLIKILVVCFSVIGDISLAFAQDTKTTDLTTIPKAYKPSLSPDIPGSKYDESLVNIFLQFLAGNVIFFAGAIAVLLLVYAGALYVTAMGDDGQMEKAKKTITWTFIGMGAILISYAAVQFVITFFLGLPS